MSPMFPAGGIFNIMKCLKTSALRSNRLTPRRVAAVRTHRSPSLSASPTKASPTNCTSNKRRRALGD